MSDEATMGGRNHDLSGRVVLVTGAGSGIGAATAKLLGAHGAVVYGADLEPGAEESGLASPLLRLDVREEADWETALGTVIERSGRLDALVHAAGISAAGPLADTSLDEWRAVLGTNLDGSFLALKHGIRAMRGTGGAIVVLGSASGIRPSAGAAAYSTSKAAVGMLVRAAARECLEAGHRIRINTVSPAGVKTPMWNTMPFFQDLVREHGSEAAAFAAMEAQGGGRFADPEDIAESVRFLISDAAGHITGVELPVDRGYTL